MSKKRVFLSVVIPAFNEEINFCKGVLIPTLAFLNKQSFSWEVIFIDDGSMDKTKNLLEKLCKRETNCQVISISHVGRPVAMRNGMLFAKGKYVLYADFDQSTPIDHLKEFLAHIKNYDLVIGARGENGTIRKDGLVEKIRAKAFVWIANFLMVAGIKDINCGFKLYRHDIAQKIFSNLLVSGARTSKGAYMGAIDTEILFLAKKFGYRISQIPVNWTRWNYVSHLHPIREPLMIIYDLFLMKIYDLMGKYKTYSKTAK